ncbi:MAG: methyltransferase domain-containing protein [Ferruginibacter sp.]
MNRFYSYINTSLKLITSFKGEKPFAVFIRQFFSANKKYGSRDRRQISSLCYNYFRLGFGAFNLAPEDKILLAFFLCETATSEFLEKLKPEWNEKINLSLQEKLAFVKDEFSLAAILPFTKNLSEGIDPEAFCKSLLIQPSLFLRVRPHANARTLKKLEKSKLIYETIGEDCIRMPIGTNVQEILTIDKDVVIQDYNSQQVLNFFRKDVYQPKLNADASDPRLTVWDCCAASGGKSILLMDIFGNNLDLTISDIRPSIVLNLHQRFKRAGIKEYKYFISDIGQPDFTPISSDFDLIICDAPCSGSGTWSRTPESLYYFKETSISDYNKLQKKITSNAFPHLKRGGIFVYITCSVFKNENEDIAAFIQEKFNCKLLEQKMLTGFTKKADSMFTAVFQKL